MRRTALVAFAGLFATAAHSEVLNCSIAPSDVQYRAIRNCPLNGPGLFDINIAAQINQKEGDYSVQVLIEHDARKCRNQTGSFVPPNNTYVTCSSEYFEATETGFKVVVDYSPGDLKSLVISADSTGGTH